MDNCFPDEWDEADDLYSDDEEYIPDMSIEEAIGNPLFSSSSRKEFQKESRSMIDSLSFTDSGKSVYTLGELLDQSHTEVPLLVKPFLQSRGLAMLAGGSDTGKSSLLRQLALDVALGKSTFLGFPINAIHRSVICVNTEDDSGAVGPLLKRQLVGQEIPREAVNRLRFVFSTEMLCYKLDSMLSAQPADLVIVDALGDLFSGNLNQANEVRQFLNAYSQLATKHNCLILFMHHTGKRTEGLKPSKNNLLGSQGLEAKMRVVLELRVDAHAPHLRHLWVLKGNYLPHELKSKSYLLSFDENQLFHNLGARESFKSPQDQQSSTNADSIGEGELWDKAKQFLEEGNSHERTAAMLKQYAEELNLKPLSKSTIARRYPRSIVNSDTITK